MKPSKSWANAHVNLKRLYDERAPEGMSQEQFGAEFGVGTQSMMSQYLNGARPLNFEAAAKFARGLRCTIADISPEMAQTLKTDIIPVLGRVAVKTAIFFLMVIPPLLPLPNPGQAGFNITQISFISRSLYTLTRIFGWLWKMSRA